MTHAGPPLAQRPDPSLRARVLVVSHDDGMRELLTTHLRRGLHPVDVADSSDCALRLVQSHAPDVAIVDWTGPGLRARDLIHALKQARPTLWVAALSGRPQVAHPRLIGWDRLFQKPFSMRALVKSLPSRALPATACTATSPRCTPGSSPRDDRPRTSVTRIRRHGLATVT